MTSKRIIFLVAALLVPFGAVRAAEAPPRKTVVIPRL